MVARNWSDVVNNPTSWLRRTAWRALDATHPKRTRRAQSESISVILLTAVIVLLVGSFGIVYLGALDDSREAPLVDAEINTTDEWVSITHAGGESVPINELDVIVRIDGNNERFAMDPGNVSGNGDSEFGPGERFRRDHGLGGGSMEVLLVHRGSNDVIHQGYLDAASTETPDGGDSTSATFSYSPANPNVGGTVTFDASGSTGDGGITNYEWDWDGDRTVDETSSDPAVDHVFASAGSYDVTLTIEDAGGDTNGTSRTVIVGAIPPSIEDTSLTDGDDGLVTSGDSVTVSATIIAGSRDVDTVVADASAFGAGNVVMTDPDGDGTYEESFEVGASAVEGNQSVTVEATDENGVSVSQETNDAVIVDTTAPEIGTFSVGDESGPGWFSYTESYRVQWSATDERLAETTVFVNRSGDIQAEYSGPSGVEVYDNTRWFASSGREHSISIIAVDEAGNRACRTVTDTADGSDPPASAYEDC